MDFSRIFCVLTLSVYYVVCSPIKSNSQLSRERNPWLYSGKFEGDIVLPKSRNGIINTFYRWPNAQVCYYISGSFNSNELSIIRNSLQNGFYGTCIRPVECWSCCNGDYIDITNNQAGCFSALGRIGGRQVLNLGSGCISRHTVIHEFNHAIGFYHEHSSPNRDNYLYIYWQNIIPSQTHNFNVLSSSVVTNFGQPYDYCSIMHYDPYAFSSNNYATLWPIYQVSCSDFGWVPNLSEIDKNKINAMYQCGSRK